jgi:hypothetical protein
MSINSSYRYYNGPDGFGNLAQSLGPRLRYSNSLRIRSSAFSHFSGVS